MGPVHTLVYNVGKGVWGDALTVSPQDFEYAWRINTFGAFLCAQQVLPTMLDDAVGNILFMGATASQRGVARTVAFASAKGGQRLMAQSLARAYGPLGVQALGLDLRAGCPALR